mmetsp:Transcript_81528/g.181490  ORF Transcript_81528/g.181490 Transcript_81528/m.181490 type:complete len:273 (-) Transcript_81528:43-861(-)
MRRPLLLAGGLALALAGAFILERARFSEHSLELATTWLVNHRVAGTFAYAIVFVTCFMLLVPSTILELVAGYAFGFWWALAVLTVVKPVAHVATFLVARHLGCLDLGAYLQEQSSLLRTVDLALQRPGQAWRIVLLVQLSFLPAGAKDCGLAMLPGVELPVFAACAALGSLPCSLGNAFLGCSAGDLHAALAGGGRGAVGAQAARLSLALGIGAALVGCLALLGCYARRALEQLPADFAGGESCAAAAESSTDSCGCAYSPLAPLPPPGCST